MWRPLSNVAASHVLSSGSLQRCERSTRRSAAAQQSPRCAAVLIPGSSCRVRITPARKRRRTVTSPSATTPAGGGGSASGGGGGGDGGGGGGKGGPTHKNQIRTTCNVCGEIKFVGGAARAEKKAPKKSAPAAVVHSYIPMRGGKGDNRARTLGSGKRRRSGGSKAKGHRGEPQKPHNSSGLRLSSIKSLLGTL